MVEAVLEDVAVAGSGEFFIVLLKTEQGDFVPITIGHLEAMSILAGRGGEKLTRPLAHDLILSSLELLDSSLSRVEITELVTTDEGGTFFAQVILAGRGIELELALAVRVDAPIWIAETVIEQVGLSDFGDGVEA